LDKTLIGYEQNFGPVERFDPLADVGGTPFAE
jgi:hypothetical protein